MVLQVVPDKHRVVVSLHPHVPKKNLIENAIIVGVSDNVIIHSEEV